MTRLSCCIPFCARTTAEPYDEWICGKHWSATSKKLRRIWFKRKRRWKAGDQSQGRHLTRIWEKLKKQAMEGAMFQ